MRCLTPQLIEVGRLGRANRIVLGCVAMTETIKDHEQRC